MKNTLKYIKYIIVHKYWVFVECIKNGQYIHAFTHDLSKLRPSEFFPYLEKFYGSGKNIEEFKMAWQHHHNRNKHHWNYWVQSNGEPLAMPKKYVDQMIADWRAMGRVFEEKAGTYFMLHRNKMKLHLKTIDLVLNSLKREDF